MMQQDRMTAPAEASSGDYAPVTVSATAAEELSRLMSEKGLDGADLRLFVQGGGCSGLRYGLAFVTEPDADDVVFESEGLSVHVDPVSITYVQGANIDYGLAPEGGAFRIDNPNQVAGCAGCGAAAGCGGAS